MGIFLFYYFFNKLGTKDWKADYSFGRRLSIAIEHDNVANLLDTLLYDSDEDYFSINALS